MPLVLSGCGGRYASAAEYAAFFGITLDLTNTPIIESILEVAASDIHAALGPVGACECGWASWVLGFLKKLNIIESVVIYSAPCGNAKVTEQWKDRMKAMLDTTWLGILSGNIELCAGYTGATVPYGDFIQQSLTEWTEAEIIYDTMLRTP